MNKETRNDEKGSVDYRGAQKRAYMELVGAMDEHAQEIRHTLDILKKAGPDSILELNECVGILGAAYGPLDEVKESLWEVDGVHLGTFDENEENEESETSQVDKETDNPELKEMLENW